MYHVILIIHTLLAVAIILAVLIQRSDSDGMALGGGSGGGNSVISGRAKANFMTRTTALLATAFFITSLTLAILTSRAGTAPSSILERLGESSTSGTVPSAAPGTENPAAPVAPAATDGTAPAPDAAAPPATDAAPSSDNKAEPASPKVPFAN